MATLVGVGRLERRVQEETSRSIRHDPPHYNLKRGCKRQPTETLDKWRDLHLYRSSTDISKSVQRSAIPPSPPSIITGGLSGHGSPEYIDTWVIIYHTVTYRASSSFIPTSIPLDFGSIALVSMQLASADDFIDLGIYTDTVLSSYKGKNRLEMPPHVFAIAESAYYNMQAYHENQCVIISGESGAGKTEAAKRIMQYIAAVSGGSNSAIQEVKDMVLATNPLLESFGCAKTLRNNNSSRHGKYLEIMFNDHGEPVGAQITNYLLEKGRVVGQIDNERDFHIFYQFTKAASVEQRELFGLQGPEAYAYTSRSNCLSVSGIDDTHDFQETLQAMNVIGLTTQEQEEIFRMLAIILWLGNVQYDEMDDGNSKISDTGVTDFIGYLMDVDPALVEKVMTTKVVETQRGGRRGK